MNGSGTEKIKHEVCALPAYTNFSVTIDLRSTKGVVETDKIIWSDPYTAVFQTDEDGKYIMNVF